MDKKADYSYPEKRIQLNQYLIATKDGQPKLCIFTA